MGAAAKRWLRACAAVLVLPLGIGACSDDKGPWRSVEWPGTVPVRSDAVLAPDGRTLRLIVDNARCEEHKTSVIEKPTFVTVRVWARRGISDCYREMRQSEIVVRLEKPLGDRVVYDGVHQDPRKTLDGTKLVQVRWIPDGTRLSVSVGISDPPLMGEQRIMEVDPDPEVNRTGVCFTVREESASDNATRDPRASHLTVHNLPAEWTVAYGARAIHWIERGRDLVIRARDEQCGIDSDTDGDLVKIAEGIRVPESD